MKRRGGVRRLVLPVLASIAVVWWFTANAVGLSSFFLGAERARVYVEVDDRSVFLLVRWGWPSRAWMAREGWRAPGDPSGRETDLFGFCFINASRTWHGHTNVTVRLVGLGLPWFYLLLLAVAPVLDPALRWLWSQRPAGRRRQRIRLGQCVRCGYDLRASRDRCPECGLTIPLSRPGVPDTIPTRVGPANEHQES